MWINLNYLSTPEPSFSSGVRCKLLTFIIAILNIIHVIIRKLYLLNLIPRLAVMP